MDKNSWKLHLLVGIACIVGFFFILGLGGRVDYDEYIILHMSQTDYDTIVARLTSINGSEPSQHEIAAYYTEEFNQ